MKFVRENFVAVALDARFERDAKDSEGDFVRSTDCVTVTAAGSARIVTSGGTKCGQAVLVSSEFLKGLKGALAAWSALPAPERNPRVGERGPADPRRAAHELPNGALIIRASNRALERQGNSFRHVRAEDFPESIRKGAVRYAEPADDFLWIAEAEWRSMIPANPKVGEPVSVPQAVAHRLLRFHLVPSRGLGEGSGWTPKEMQEGKLTLTVHEATPKKVVLRLEGSARFRRDWGKAGIHTYEPSLLGYIEIDPARGAWTRFDAVAVGDVTGSPNGENNQGQREGAHPLGVAFELIQETAPMHRLHPRGVRDGAAAYWGTAR